MHHSNAGFILALVAWLMFASFSVWGIPEGSGSVGCNWPPPTPPNGVSVLTRVHLDLIWHMESNSTLDHSNGGQCILNVSSNTLSTRLIDWIRRIGNISAKCKPPLKNLYVTLYSFPHVTFQLTINSQIEIIILWTSFD